LNGGFAFQSSGKIKFSDACAAVRKEFLARRRTSYYATFCPQPAGLALPFGQNRLE